MNKTIIIVTILAALAFICSCTQSKLETTYNNQENKIDSYINGQIEKNQSYRAVRNGGGNRLVTVEGEGEELTPNGYVSFYYAGYTFNGNFSQSGMFVTNHQATAEQAGWNLTDADYSLYETNLADAKLIQGLKDGLIGVREGEECEILFSGKYGFGDEDFGIIPANSALLYKIWVVGVANN